MKEIEYHGLTFRIFYDPRAKLYYCGIPGFTIPTIYVGNTETEVKEAVEDQLIEYLDFCNDEGSCYETKIGYDIHEAYSTGWIVRITGSYAKETDAQPNFKRQMQKQIEDKKIENLMDSLDKSHPNFLKIHGTYRKLEEVTEKCADLAEQMQHERMKLIQMAKEENSAHVGGHGIEVFKVNRLGIQNPIST